MPEPAAGSFANPLAGFWLGGFEGADHVNAAGQPLDMVAASGHLARLDEDHRRARQAGFAAVRESIGWRLAEDGAGRIDLRRAQAVAASAARHGLQVAWTLMHYGVPAGLSLHDDRLIDRFARFAAAVARTIGLASARPPVFNLVNEISFLAWAASHSGLLHPPDGLAPDDPAAQADAAGISGYAVKRRLVRAHLAARAAVQAVDPRTRFLVVDPLVHVVAPAGDADPDGALAARAARVAAWQWQAWDLLAGRIEPALGGHAAALDLVGVNHYHASQWEAGSERRLDWHGRDPRRAPLSALLAGAWQRYGRPLVVAETSHVGVGRADWLHDVAHGVRQARAAGVPVQGLCLYPLVDRPDWVQPAHWHRSGLWHVPAAETAGTAVASGAGVGMAAGGAGPAAVAAVTDVADAADTADVADAADAADAAGTARATGAALSRVVDGDYLQALRQWQRALPGSAAGATARRPPLLAFSHLRWRFVRHRTHQLLSRLAARWPTVVVVEEPCDSAGRPPWLDAVPHGPGLTVLVPHLPLPMAAQGFAQGPSAIALQRLLHAWWRDRGLAAPLCWISTPMALPLAQALQPRALVLDVADELAGFLHPPADLPALEQAALQQADLVLAAGAALAAPRADLAGDRLCLLPNGADRRLFRPGGPVPGSWESDEAALLQAGCAGHPGPWLGMAGVIDERTDLALLAALADARPQWQWMLVGPVVKIDAAALPRRPNLHWLGLQPHRVLPGLLAGWQAVVLPWADHLATRHAAPIQLLEALAAGLPVVATRLPGTVGQCALARAGDRVRLVLPGPLAQALPDWLAACEAALADGRLARPTWRLPGSMDWDAVAQRADALLCGLLRARGG